MPKKKTDSIIPQAKLLRLFQIIAVLKSGHWSIAHLAERFDTSERTIYRYIQLLEQVDFLVEKDFANNYFIITSEEDPSSTQFTVSETRLIKKLIQSGAKSSPIKNILLRKLALNSEIDGLPNLFVDARIGKFIEQLTEAIRNKSQVILKSYHSANSGEIRDRLVEPFQFGDNYASVQALDTHDKVCKQFKLERIGDVIGLKSGFQYENMHRKGKNEIFGFVGDAETWVTLKLSLRAYLLLREEFPMAIPYLTKEEVDYQFHGPVSSFEGVGRFILGLVDEIKVSGPSSLVDYIKARINKSDFA